MKSMQDFYNIAILIQGKFKGATKTLVRSEINSNGTWYSVSYTNELGVSVAGSFMQKTPQAALMNCQREYKIHNKLPKKDIKINTH